MATTATRADSRVPRTPLFRVHGSRIARVAALALGCLYFATAISKGQEIGSSSTAISSVMPILSEYAPILIWALVLTELLLAASLISGMGRRWAALASCGLGCIFILWHITLARSGTDVSCGCGVPHVVTRLFGEAATGVYLAVFVTVLSLGIAISQRTNFYPERTNHENS